MHLPGKDNVANTKNCPSSVSENASKTICVYKPKFKKNETVVFYLDFQCIIYIASFQLGSIIHRLLFSESTMNIVNALLASTRVFA